MAQVKLSAAGEMFFGTNVTPRSFEQWIAFLRRELKKNQRKRITASHNLHSIYLRHSNPDMAEFYAKADDCFIDGMPVRRLFELFSPNADFNHRFTLMDNFPQFLMAAQREKWRIYYLGSTEHVAQKSLERIRREYPDLDMHLHHGYITDNAAVIDNINKHSPDILLLGMGMPLQERWLLENFEQLEFGWVVQAGATLDYFTGEQAKPPLWLSAAGLGWIYRLAHDPRRLARRYLLEPWWLIAPIYRHWRLQRQENGTPRT